MKKMNIKQQGAVSLFVVIFISLLIVTITVSFTRIMVTEQQQATVNDLSKSAYDSAAAGVEDAKRAIIRMQSICSTGTANQCRNAKEAIDLTTAPACNASVRTLSDVYASSTNGEVKVKTAGDAISGQLDQAYTCVKIDLDTADYLGLLPKGDSVVIPLKSVNDFNRIKIEWFNSKDLSASNVNASNNFSINVGSGTTLPTTWPSNRPPIFRAQLVKFETSSGNFKLEDLDYNTDNNYASTLFLYPNSTGVSTTSFGNDKRKLFTTSSGSSAAGVVARPTPIVCSSTVSSGGYACSVTITVNPGLASAAAYTINPNDTAFLRISTLYNSASYRVSLLNNNTVVNFDGVQPEIDSTGRANDLFRRVLSRVEATDTYFPYPDGAVDITGNFCKDFYVTDSTAGDGYDDNAGAIACNP